MELDQKESKKLFQLALSTFKLKEFFDFHIFLCDCSGRTITKKDAEIQSILNALNGTGAQKKKIGQHWAEV